MIDDQKQLAKKRDEIAKLVVESQANQEEIERLNADNENKQDAMEKLNLEVTVVVTEKMTLQKEYYGLEAELRRLKKDYKESRVNFNLQLDENSKVNKKNSEYRELILAN